MRQMLATAHVYVLTRVGTYLVESLHIQHTET
jgi:hypothetical protein